MQLLTGPLIEPITLAEAKAFLRVEHNDDDAMIKALIAGARAQIEWHTRRIMNTQTWRPVRDAWPASGQINLPSLPLRSLIAVRIHNGAVMAAIDMQSFIVDTVNGRIIMSSTSIPTRPAGIELDCELGYDPLASDVPEALRPALRLLLAHDYEHRAIGNGKAAGLPSHVATQIAPYRVLAL